MTDIVLIVVGIIVAVARFTIAPRLNIPTASGSYEAFAHLFVGGLVGAWIVNRTKWVWLGIAIVISLVEVVAFMIQKYS